uniref:Uncharacterized protein n=1 Tax=Nelumbo nucifera TaxID=4432 RepID=A0A822YVS7_NELNU|nr:TPA_asm: hypothetical protein HUJ06_005855 [Nelumbo nucifera]
MSTESFSRLGLSEPTITMKAIQDMGFDKMAECLVMMKLTEYCKQTLRMAQGKLLKFYQRLKISGICHCRQLRYTLVWMMGGQRSLMI